MKHHRLGCCFGLAAIAVLIVSAGRVEAGADTGISVSPGDWTNLGHWNNGVPTSADDAFIGSGSIGLNVAMCTLDTAGQECDRLYIGHLADGNGQLDFTGGSLKVYGVGTNPDAAIGERGVGVVNHSAGTWDNGGSLFSIGSDTTGEGEYNLSGSGVVSNISTLYVGDKGSGTLNISGSGTLQDITTATYVGNSGSGSGVVSITGGKWDNGGASMAIGRVSNSYGQVSISAGVLTNIYNFSVGDEGYGALNISGSAAIWNVRPAGGGYTYVGATDGGTGTVTQSGGTWNNGAKQIIIGDYGNGAFEISGGVLTNVSRIYLGNRTTGVGLLSIVGSDAEIYVTDEFRGANAGTETLRITPDPGGISPINMLSEISPGKTWLDNTTLEVDFSNYDSTDALTIINHTSTYDARTPFLATNILTKGWSAEVEYAAGATRLINISQPPKGFVMSIR